MNAPFPGGKRPVELDAALVQRAEKLTRDLPGTIERLLAAHLAEQDSRLAQQRQDAEAHAAATNAFIEKHGFWAEEYRSF
ncbi:type II toxin-antitoxin system CcdA family antitoxin [Falsiroseomonas sp. E2-1-a20]|uniref:type II toxin-antitoxin system CcdA family antitoxin n=1 Tax=Falsiroseomonas sp. E2-1-a20 TaxID=3239300 RepID=UPI003F331047